MKNNIEIRPNGIKITKRTGNRYPMYFVTGSKNGPWDYLRNARRDADNPVSVEAAIDAVQCGATHYHVGWRQYLKVEGTEVKVLMKCKWTRCGVDTSIFTSSAGYIATLDKVVHNG